jgi:hypothetical protein
MKGHSLRMMSNFDDELSSIEKQDPALHPFSSSLGLLLCPSSNGSCRANERQAI